MKEKATLELTHSYVIDLSGQAIGAKKGSSVTIRDSLIQRCSSVGQFNDSHIEIDACCFTDIPNDDRIFAENDNDGLYISGGDATISNTTIMYTKDDGIDTGGGNRSGDITIENCWIDSCFHEGIALSNNGTRTKKQRIINTVVTNCQQGIELGYSSPSHDIKVRHCLFMNNGIGIRCGDNYSWGMPNGHIRIIDTISADNARDTWNFDPSKWATFPGSMKIVNSLFSDYQDLYPDNVVGNPKFDSRWRLKASSVGYGAGSDGKSVGLTD